MFCALELCSIFLLQHFSYSINIVLFFVVFCFVPKRPLCVSAGLCYSTCQYMLKVYTISSIKMYKLLVEQVVYL